MAHRKSPADLDEVFGALDRTGALEMCREEFRCGGYPKLHQSIPLLEHRRQLLLDIDWTIGQLAAAKALILSANTGAAPMLEFTSDEEAPTFEERNRTHHRQPASLVQFFAQSPLADADLNLERDRARRTLFKRLRRQRALNAER